MKLKNLFFVVVAAGLAMLAACGGDDKQEAKKPTVTFQSGSGFVSSDVDSHFDSFVKIGIRAFSNENTLSSVKISLATNGGTAGVIEDTVLNAKTITWDYNFKVKGGAGDKLTLTVTANDKNGTSASASLTVTIVPQTMPISGPQNQYVYNLQGLNEGAYDLYTSTNIKSSGSETVKDLKDMTLSSGGAVFSKAWTSGNFGKFVRVTSNDFANTTSTDYLWTLWQSEGSKATDKVTNIVKDDYILVKTGQSIPFNIYIIHVVEVYDTPTVGDNNDYIKFEYKGFTQ